MSKDNKRERAIRSVTDELLTQKFTTELGQKARVDRSSLQGEHMDQLRAVISDVGEDLLRVKAVPRGMTYCGSLCIHVYKSEVLRTAVFATTSNLGSMTFDLADGALRELTGSTMEQYGKSRQKLRSGF